MPAVVLRKVWNHAHLITAGRALSALNELEAGRSKPVIPADGVAEPPAILSRL
jgi:hypothetical protein